MKKQNGDIIEVDSLTKRFGKVVAVNQVSFNVVEGEIFGFLGPNGAGKTTTIRMLTGILEPDSGSILIDGIDMGKNPIKAKLNMGIMPETSNIYVDLTAKQNIVMAGRFYGISKRELNKRAEALLQQFELYERKDDIVKTFSKGMKQRVNIASAIVHEPKLLFLDEPTVGLDVRSHRLIRNIIKEMSQRGTTIFFTTHNIEEANLLCERVAIISKGEIAVIDRPEILRRAFEKIQSVEVCFDKPIDEASFEKGELINRVERLGNKWKLYTDNPDQLVKYLARFAQEQNLSIVAMDICGASLEDAFLKFTEEKM